MSFPRFRFGGGSKAGATTTTAVDNATEISDGNLTYVAEQGGNNSLPSYQEAVGAPVERQSPFGYDVGPVTIIFLNISKMVGTGVYSTRKQASAPLYCLQVTDRYTSIVNLSGNRLRRAELNLLVPRLCLIALVACCVLGVCILLPKPLWFRSCVPRASVSTTKIFLSDRIRCAVGCIIFQQRELYWYDGNAPMSAERC